MSMPLESRQVPLSPPRLKRRLAVASFLAALYPPVVVVGQALLSPLVHHQDVQVCRTFTFPSGLVKQSCEIHNASPLLGVIAVATYVMIAAILVTLMSGHLALYHAQRDGLTPSRRALAIIGLVLGYAWAALGLFILAAQANAE
jgi:hypothetical protein